MLCGKVSRSAAQQSIFAGLEVPILSKAFLLHLHALFTAPLVLAPFLHVHALNRAAICAAVGPTKWVTLRSYSQYGACRWLAQAA